MKKQRTMEARIKVKKTGEKTKVKGSGKGKATPKRPKNIRFLGGDKNILVIAPHGVKGDDNYTNVIAEELNEKFGFYAIINERYQKPSTVGRPPNVNDNPLDLNKIREAELVPNDRYMTCIDEFSNEIIEKHGEALVFHIHGIKNRNIKAAAKKVPPDELPCKTSEVDILIGYGQRKQQGNHPLTASKKTIDAVIHNLEQNGICSVRAPLEPITVMRKDKNYCGADKRRMNQYFSDSGLPVQSIQVEIRAFGLRTGQKVAREAANPLGKAITATMETEQEAEHKSVWTTLSKHGIYKHVKVKEIDLPDRTFESRISKYGADEEAFANLVDDIREKGILQNIIVRECPGKDKYQLICGFRRLAALEKVFQGKDQKKFFQEQKVPARVFKSLPDESAYQVSFSENLARRDLTLWEIANSCRATRENLQKEGWKEGEIDKYLADLLKKDARTVRRYLSVSTITNEGIRKDLHNGKIDISIAGIFARDGFTEEDRGALHAFYKKNPMASRLFNEIAHNLLKLKEWSGLNVKRIMGIPTAKDFLSIDPDELKKRVEYLQKARNKSIVHILRHEMKDLKKPIDTVKSNDHFALFFEGFSKESKSLEKKMTQVFRTKKVPGDLTIEPGRDLEKKIVKLTVSAPVTDIPKMINLTAKELKDDFASLAKLFQKVPSPTTQKVNKEKVKINKNSTIAFMIRLEELQSVLRALNKDGVPTDESKGQILVRTLSNNKVQFGRINRNGLLIEKETEVYQEGSVALLLSDIYTPIMNIKGGKNTECVVTGINTPPEPEGKEGMLSISVKSINFIMDTPTYSPIELMKYYDLHLPPKPLIRIDASELKAALNKVLTCIDPREIRRSITGTLFKIDKENLTITGTNGIKLFETVKPHSGVSVSEGELIVSFYTGKLLKEVLQKEAGNVRIGVSKNVIYFQVDNLLVIGKLIRDKEYPNYRPMFTEADNSFRLPISKLRQLASSISTIADPEDNHRMTLKSGNNLVVFQNEKGTAECHIENVKGRIDLDVNAAYLTKLAKKLDGEKVEVRYITGNNYITLHSDEDSQRALLTTVKRRSDDNQSESKPKKAKTYGTREWAVHSVNCCNGCSHDCVYCYGKFMAKRRVKGHIPLDKWKEEEVRQKDVAKGYRKREGRIMFPSSHDITPSNFKACYTVLEKLLEAGNEVLVVSKPHFECIQPICDGLVRFKDSILFRFTIGAKNDGILSIWEPNAPSYEERKRCLNHAFDLGYNTSVSVEPMLDSENIDSLIKDLMPLVSDAIWIGKMSHIGRIISNNGDLKEEIRKIKESQSDDKIKVIYERHKENPKIKWKESIKKVVGIPPVEKPGMDI